MEKTHPDEIEAIARQTQRVEFSEFTEDRLTAWRTDMGGEKYERMTTDFSDRTGYAQIVNLGTEKETVDETPWEVERANKTKVQRKAMWERWDSGSRSTWTDNDGQIIVELEEGPDFRIATTITNKGLYQTTACKLGKTKERPKWPLIVGEEEFFAAAQLLPPSAYFIENLCIVTDDNGKKVVDRHLYARNTEQLRGTPDTYKTMLVTSDNGVARYGSDEHGLEPDHVPTTEVVN
ncbi:MAG: hypothetical protein UV05_C0011G0001 [candidate division CPR1 bacterium GW2011_GWA2_42_17]|uniref:Uncharacterized protein n=1 Tax=candidate division CPR1 bacterium GW2011_GWA2_42_17 TaxID=1618341 RepID=A0A0G0Z612_9BACT|nr:MAG: hypothetical protein UV05_C0011G0001 [candidate division CPR1 bacterium GW2011_GWA2_42_17]